MIENINLLETATIALLVAYVVYSLLNPDNKQRYKVFLPLRSTTKITNSATSTNSHFNTTINITNSLYIIKRNRPAPADGPPVVEQPAGEPGAGDGEGQQHRDEGTEGQAKG